MQLERRPDLLLAAPAIALVKFAAMAGAAKAVANARAMMSFFMLVSLG
jgi:hypothetical protein